MRRWTPALFLLLLMTGTVAAQVQKLPRLVVSKNGRFIQTESGQPFFWLGDTGWLLFIKLTREEILQYLDKRKEQGYNVIQVMVLHDMKNAVNRYGDSALVKRDAAHPLVTPGNAFDKEAEYDFWDHVDFAIDAAAERGIYMALVPVWGSNVKGGLVNRQQAHAYATFLASRYRSKSNIIWLNGGDINGSDSIEVWKELGRTIKQNDKDHLVSFHPRGRTTSSRWFHNEPWLDFNMFQSGHRNYIQDTSKGETHYGEDNWKYIREDFSRKPNKPSLDGEPAYEGIPQGLHDTTQVYWTAADLRRYAWWSVLAGGAGFTYGHNAVMQFYRPQDKGSAYGAKKFWTQALDDSGALHMQWMKKLIQAHTHMDRIPDQDLVVDNGTRYDRTVASRGSDYALLYTYTGNTMKVRMGWISGSRVKAKWYDPRTGQYIPAAVFGNKGIWTFDPPGEKRNGNDWVLVLESMK